MDTTVVVAKPWWKSKTVWVNLLAALISIAAELQHAIPLPERVSTYVVAVVAVANIVLRLLTAQPVTASMSEDVRVVPGPRR